MNISKCETITKYFIDVTENISVIVNVVNNKTMYIEKITMWLEFEEDIFDYYAKVKYQRKIKDIHNLENEIEEFVLDRFDKMKGKLDEVVEKYRPVAIIK